jgi:hypothetical protein
MFVEPCNRGKSTDFQLDVSWYMTVSKLFRYVCLNFSTCKMTSSIFKLDLDKVI